MKPNFALTLSFEGIGLLHRAFPGWHLVGEIGLDSDSLLSDLKSLRDKAVSLDPSGLRSKLVIPNDQIRYIEFDIGDTDDDDIPDQVRQHLDGATPYTLDDLAYDWSDDGSTIRVAAVARETLREAEAFAKEHRFNPVSFVAMPENGSFDGEPFFGETTHARTLGEDIERDPVPVRVIGTAKMPEPAPVLEPPEIDEAETEAPFFRRSGQPTQPETPVAPLPAEEPVTGFADPPAAFERSEPPLENDLSDSDTDTLDDIQDSDPAEAAEPDPPASDPETSPRDAAAFSSIRALRGAAPATAPKLDGVARHFTPVHVSAQVNADSLPRDIDPDPGPSESEVESLPQTAAPDAIPVAPPEPEPEVTIADRSLTEPSEPAEFTTRREAPVIAASRPHYREPSTEEQQRMTIFGARDAEPVGGKPKYLGLVLTAILLLFLAGVAAWASLFLDDGLAGFFRSDDDLIIADVPALPDPTPEAPSEDDGVDAVIAALPQPGDEVEGALSDTLSQPRPLELTEDELRARYAATGIWPVAPEIPDTPAPDSLEEFYQTSIDPTVNFQDAIALPDGAGLSPDERPTTPNSPTSAGTTFALDDRGLVVATAAGALTPDGILVFAGPPPAQPAAMPKREIVQEVVAPGTPVNLQLAAFRPRTRPGDLAEQVERDTLNGRTRVELAALRPKLRPQSAQEAAEIAARQSAATEEPGTQPFIDLDAVNSAVNAAVDNGADLELASALPQAVASSLKPNVRPRNFDSIVNRSTQTQQVAVSASQRIAPRIPTATSVAKQATQRNVLKLRKVNLIGVYGTPSSRRALVRLSNGRYRKVKVGDRLDGGKVSAIGDGELRYVKGGRNVTLKMPRG